MNKDKISDGLIFVVLALLIFVAFMLMPDGYEARTVFTLVVGFLTGVWYVRRNK